MFIYLENFKILMSLDFSLEYLNAHKEEYDPCRMVEILMACPDEVLCTYPLTMIVFAYEGFACGQTELVSRLCTLLDKTVRVSPEEKEMLKEMRDAGIKITARFRPDDAETDVGRMLD